MQFIEYSIQYKKTVGKERVEKTFCIKEEEKILFEKTTKYLLIFYKIIELYNFIWYNIANERARKKRRF